MSRVWKPVLLLLVCWLLAGCSYYHVVESGDTLYKLSHDYGVSVQDIQRANPGVDPYNLQVGDRIKIPRAPNQTLRDYSEQNPRANRQTPRPVATPTPRPQPTPRINATPRPQPPTPTPEPNTAARFLWPLDGGTIVHKFGDRDGGVVMRWLDIEAAEGTPVRAAAAGTVILSSDRFRGYGNMIIIRHDDNFVSIYAYNKKNLVQENQQVKQGQLIAEVGRTGRVEKPTLHFEIRIGSQAVDPLLYLPRR